MNDMLNKVSEGRLRARIVAVLSIDKIRKAHRLMEAMMEEIDRDEVGSVVIRLNN